jgi:hypothetical protein
MRSINVDVLRYAIPANLLLLLSSTAQLLKFCTRAVLLAPTFNR